MDKEITIRNIVRLASPAALSYATVIMVGMIDLIFIGKLGTVAVAASAIGVSVATTMYSFLDGFRISTSVLAAQYLGAKKHEALKQILFISLGTALVVGLCTIPFASPVSKLIFYFIGNLEIYTQGYSYLHIRLLSITFILITFSIVGFFRGLHNTKIQLIISLVISGLNVVFDYLLIYGKYGFPRMGVTGAALGTLIAEGIGMLFAIAILFTHPLTKNIIHFQKPCHMFFKKFIMISAETGIYGGSANLAMSVFALILGTLGTKSLAIYQIGSQLFFLSYLPQAGFFVAISIISGRLLGAQKYNLITPATIRAIMSALVVAIIVGSILLSFPEPIISLFSPTDKSVTQGVISILWLICIDQLLCSGVVVLRGALTGINNTRFITITMLATGYGFFLPLAYVLSMVFNMGIIGGYIAFVIWSVIDLFIFSARLIVLKKRFNQQFIPAPSTQESTIEQQISPLQEQETIV